MTCVAAGGSPHSAADAKYPRVIWVLLGGSLLVRAAGFAYPFMSFHVAQQGHGPAAVGAVLAAFGAGWVVGELECGGLVDRYGRRLTLVATMVLAATVLILMAGAHTLPALMVGAALAGLVYDAPRPVLSAAIAELVPDPAARAKVDAWRYGCVVNVGAAITGGVGGLLADRIGIPTLFWINAIACAVFAMVAARCIPAQSLCTTSAPKTTYWRALCDRRLVLLLLSSVATLTALMGLLSAMPMLMTAHGLGAGAFGAAQLANALAVVVLTPLITPWLSARAAVRPRLDILAGAALWTSACMATAAFAQTTAAFSVAAAACAPGEIAWSVVAAGIVHRIAPPAQRGRYHGIWGTALATAAIIAPILASYSLLHGGEPLVAATTLAAGVIGAALAAPLACALVSGEREIIELTT
ncbi:MFS transporter [Mycobacterium sp.]|uniref:MFS transporter n=1 Tax=Mycobacterium sp. TaxID=1785 RepID=UPI003C713024